MNILEHKCTQPEYLSHCSTMYGLLLGSRTIPMAYNTIRSISELSLSTCSLIFLGLLTQPDTVRKFIIICTFVTMFFFMCLYFAYKVSFSYSLSFYYFAKYVSLLLLLFLHFSNTCILSPHSCKNCSAFLFYQNFYYMHHQQQLQGNRLMGLVGDQTSHFDWKDIYHFYVMQPECLFWTENIYKPAATL